MNSARRLIDDEESTIIEENSEIFDEADHRKMIDAYDQLPVMISKPDTPDQVNAEPVSLDDICVGGSGTYDFSKVQDRHIKDVTNKQKRPFLRRGQGKNCLNNKPAVKKAQTQKRPSSAPARSMPKVAARSTATKSTVKPKPIQKQVKNKENIKPVSKPKLKTKKSVYDQSPEGMVMLEFFLRVHPKPLRALVIEVDH